MTLDTPTPINPHQAAPENISKPSSSNPTLEKNLGEYLKCAVAALFLGFTILISLIMFPIFLISAVQMVFRGIIIGVRYFYHRIFGKLTH